MPTAPSEWKKCVVVGARCSIVYETGLEKTEMDAFGIGMIALLAAGSYLLGRWSTWGASWESAFKTVNKACDNWRQIAADWEEEARKWREMAETGS
mgnify:FL=1